MSDSPPAANPIMADPKKADGVEFRLRNITPAAVAVNNRSETRTAKNLSSKKPVIKRPTSPDAPITDSACADVPREIPRSVNIAERCEINPLKLTEYKKIAVTRSRNGLVKMDDLVVSGRLDSLR
jgi:hypothetical protein